MKKETYDEIGRNYNLTRKADPYIALQLYHLTGVDSHATCLDIGCGTGNYTSMLALRGLKCTGVDPSELMLSNAKLNTPEITWLKGSAEDIPSGNETFDTAIATLTIHHWKSLPLAFKEVNRVLKKDAVFVIFTSTPQQMEGYWLNHYFPEMMKKSMSVMPTFEKIETALVQSGFAVSGTEKYFVQPDLQDLFLYCGKDKPLIYFEETVRKGITSFSFHSANAEVERGLTQLMDDIGTGQFKKIKSEYDNDSGDYLFVVAKKV
jgi:ubiquinone/menaquinone biosynthesis C-methylase UbiE